MRKLYSILLLLTFPFSLAYAVHQYKEKEYQTVWCAKEKGTAEYLLDDKARVDCLTSEYAVEFDFAPKWAESIGQALYYALKTGKKPGVVLIFEEDGDQYLERINKVAEQYNIKVWTMKPEDLNNDKEARPEGNGVIRGVTHQQHN